MDNISTGTEQNDWNLRAAHPGEQLEIDELFTSFVLTADRLVKIEVQLGNADNLLHSNGGIVAVTAKVISVDTGDELFMPQVQMNVAAGDTLIRISIPPFWAKLGDTIKVFAKGSNTNDISVGGKVWVYDVAPGDVNIAAAAVVAALMADSSFTVGQSMTFSTLQKLLAAWVAGTWQSKSGSSTIKELLDADDNATVVAEHTLAVNTPFRETSVQ